MFHDLDLTLDQIIRAAPAVALPELNGADVSFETPDKSFNPNGAAVNLFLYDVKENMMLRDPVPVTRRQGDMFVRQRPPLRVDCTYVVTAWQNPPTDSNVRASHQLLAQTLLWLSRFPVIPEDRLQGGLQQAIERTMPDGENFELPTMVAQMNGSKDSVGEFWSALGIPPRPYFNLVATIPMDLVEPAEGPLVTTKIIGVEPAPGPDEETLIAIGGRIVDPSGNPIADAVIDVVDSGIRTKSQGLVETDDGRLIGEDDVGRYVIPQITRGQHEFRVSAAGYQQKFTKIEIISSSQDYVIRLRPL